MLWQLWYRIFPVIVVISIPSSRVTAQKVVSGTTGIEKTIIVRDGSPAKGNPVYGRNYFRNKSPFTVKDSSVLFFLRGRLNASKVMLSGSFCNWSPVALPMTRTDSGWVVNVILPFGKHEYKFIIDGTWEIDDDNLLSVSDISGNTNSIYYKPNLFFSIPSFFKARNIYLAGSFNKWRNNELRMIKTKDGWILPFYLDKGTYNYKFFVEDKMAGNLIESPYLMPSFNTSSAHYGFNLIINRNLNYEKQKQIQDPTREESRARLDRMISEGIEHSLAGDQIKALAYFTKAESVARQYDPFALTRVWLNIAALYGEVFDIPNQLKYLQQAYINCEKWEDVQTRAMVIEKLGYCYMNFYIPKAARYFEEALKEYELTGAVKEAALTAGNLGYASFLISDTTKGLYYTRRSLLANQEAKNEIGIATNYWVLADYYRKESATMPLAIDYTGRSLEIFERQNNQKGMAEVLSVISSLYVTAPDSLLKKMGTEPSQKLQKAIAAARRSLRIYRQLKDLKQLDLLLLLSQTYERANRYDSALYYFKRYVDFVNEVADVEKQKQIARLEWKYDADKKEEYLTLQKQISEALTQQQRQQLELRNKELLLTKQEKDIQALAYLKAQGDLQNEQLVRQQKEEQLRNAEQEKLLQHAQVKTLRHEKAIAKLHQQRQWIYSAAVFILLAFIAAFFIYRWRIRSIKLEAQLVKKQSEQQQKEAEFQHRLADISLTALRSQMNPHFIFNCLNSIKLYTIQNDTAAATSYLSRFSKLIRLVLDNSRSDRITLKSELQALELYIQMEAMRFKDKLHYTITVAGDVETDYIELPPLLLQPYVENAIWHGLMHKEEGGHVDIKVGLVNEGSMVEIHIIDDGVGRAKANEFNNKVHAKHASYGMKATSERIALINQIYKTGANVAVHDLVDPGGQPAGTQVTIQIPI